MANSTPDMNKPVSSEARQPHRLGALRQRREFLFVQHNGVRQVMPHFILQVAIPAPPASSGHSRAGVTASKKVGNAVARNRAKRRMRALFCELACPELPFSADYVLVARHSLVTAPFCELKADFITAAGRVHQKLIKTAEYYCDICYS